MRKHCIAAAILALLLALCIGAASADTGDVTKRETKAYYDALGNHYAGVIPAETSVLVKEYGPFVSRIEVKNKIVYVLTNSLERKKTPQYYETTLKAGTLVYQQPSFFSSVATVEKATRVYICSLKGDWVMVRGGKQGIYAYVPAMDIEGWKLAK